MPPIKVSPIACLGSMVSPLSVSAVLPTCSVTPCSPSVIPSLTPAPRVLVIVLPVVPRMALFKPGIPKAPTALSAPLNTAVPIAPAQSSPVGSFSTP